MSERALTPPVRTVGLAGLLNPGTALDPHAAERERKAALASAYANGLRDGESALLAASGRAEASAAAQHATALAAAHEAQQALIASVAESLAELAIQIARAVIAAEPVARTETIVSLVAEALAAAPAEAGGTVHVAPSARDQAQAALPQGWVAAADPALASGVARAMLGAGALTASLERRLAHLATLMAEDC